jgi:hypothetical protein
VAQNGPGEGEFYVCVRRHEELLHTERQLCKRFNCSVNMFWKRAWMTHAPVVHAPTEVFVEPDLP